MAVCRKAEEYVWQAKTVVAVSVLISVVALAGVGLALWIIIYIDDFRPIIGLPMWNAVIGYASLCGFTTLCGLLGVCAAATRNIYLLFIYAILNLANIVNESGLWVFMFLRRRQISSELPKSISTHYVDYSQVLSREFSRCVLQTDSRGYTDDTLAACSSDISYWLSNTVWAALGTLAALICLQAFILVITLMMRQLLIELMQRSSYGFDSASIPDIALKSFPPPREAWGEDTTPAPPANHPKAVHGRVPHPSHCKCNCHGHASGACETHGTSAAGSMFIKF